MMHTLLAAALVPLALGDYSYSFTDAPTAAPTTLTASPTSSMAPTRTETYCTDAPRINKCVASIPREFPPPPRRLRDN